MSHLFSSGVNASIASKAKMARILSNAVELIRKTPTTEAELRIEAGVQIKKQLDAVVSMVEVHSDILSRREIVSLFETYAELTATYNKLISL